MNRFSVKMSKGIHVGFVVGFVSAAARAQKLKLCDWLKKIPATNQTNQMHVKSFFPALGRAHVCLLRGDQGYVVADF